jgi:hypothetical protein
VYTTQTIATNVAKNAYLEKKTLASLVFSSIIAPIAKAQQYERLYLFMSK